MKSTEEGIYQYWIEVFNEEKLYPQVLAFSQTWPDTVSFFLSFFDLPNNLQYEMVSDPERVLEIGEAALISKYKEMGTDISYCHVRVTELPEERFRAVNSFRVADIGQLVQLNDVMVTMVSEVRAKIILACFECNACGFRFKIDQDEFMFVEPTVCDKEEGGCGKKATSFRFMPALSVFIDTQRIEIQDPPDAIEGRLQPRRVMVRLEDDLVDRVAPGDRVNLVAYQKVKQRREGGSVKSVEMTGYFEGLYIKGRSDTEDNTLTEKDVELIEHIKNNNPLDLLVSSIAPTIYGFDDIKLALALQLFGGSCENGNRGEFHVLLVGDPGTAKSKLLINVSKFAPISIYSTGSGTSKAGLTACATRDEAGGEGRWALEAGVLVLSDKGLAIVDELDKMNKDEVSALNEALEQQTVTVNKATIRATLHARCSLLAAANPKSGKYNINTTLGEQVDIPAPVRTRFALIFIIVDKPKKERDKEIFKTIVNNWRGVRGEVELTPAIWRKYVKEAKKINPVLDDPDLEEKTWAQYWDMRQSYGNDREQGGGSKIVSARQLEDIIRIAGASARCRMDAKIREEDINRAIGLIRKSVMEAGDQGELMSGVKAEKRPLMEWITTVLGDGEMDRQSLLRLAEREGYFMTDRDIETFERNGMIYEPRFGTLKVVKG